MSLRLWRHLETNSNLWCSNKLWLTNLIFLMFSSKHRLHLSLYLTGVRATPMIFQSIWWFRYFSINCEIILESVVWYFYFGRKMSIYVYNVLVSIATRKFQWKYSVYLIFWGVHICLVNNIVIFIFSFTGQCSIFPRWSLNETAAEVKIYIYFFIIEIYTLCNDC